MNSSITRRFSSSLKKRLSLSNNNNNKSSFFLSHAQGDVGDICNGIANDLKHQLKIYKVWFDMTANDLSSQGMMNGIKECDNFICFISSSNIVIVRSAV